MNKTRHLDTAIQIMGGGKRAKAAWRNSNPQMRGDYELALQKQGWRVTDNNAQSCELQKPGTRKRMMVFNGDRVSISFDGITWKPLNQHARRNLLLGAQ